MTAIVHRIETPSTRDVWAAEGDGQTAHLVLAAQLLTEQAALCGYEPRADWMATDGPHPVGYSFRCDLRAAAEQFAEAGHGENGGDERNVETAKGEVMRAMVRQIVHDPSKWHATERRKKGTEHV